MSELKFTLAFFLFAFAIAQDYVGFRFSEGGVVKNYGKIPDGNSWVSYVNKFKKHLNSNAKPTVIVIVSYYDDNGVIVFGFPAPSGVKKTSYIKFDSKDKYEKILSVFDSKDINVWLQVEPGNNDLVKLAEIVYKKYGKHSCVKGFGIDLEWWKPKGDGKGSKISDSDAKKVVNFVRKQNKKHTVFVKHWEQGFMPPSYRDGLIFIDDSQEFGSMSDVKSTFRSWAKKFKNNPVMFQIGYKADKKLWSSDPIKFAKEIRDEVSKVNKHVGIIWVDFTMKDALSKM